MYSTTVLKAGKKKILLETFDNTLSLQPRSTEKSLAHKLSERAYRVEKNVYDVNPQSFGKRLFQASFLGQCKLASQPPRYPLLPYKPDDIININNTIFLFSHEKKDMGYFSSLCLAQKEKKGTFSHIHFRLMAGFEHTWRGTGLFYEPTAQSMIRTLEGFAGTFPRENPLINITQFAMVSAGTPGVLHHFSQYFKTHFKAPPLHLGDRIATNLALMMGLGKIMNIKTGISNIQLPVKHKITVLPENTKNKKTGRKLFDDVSRYDALQLREGDGISARQALVPLKTFLRVKKNYLTAIKKLSLQKNRAFSLLSSRPNAESARAGNQKNLSIKTFFINNNA